MSALAVIFDPPALGSFTAEEVDACVRAGADLRPSEQHDGRPVADLDGPAGDALYDRLLPVAAAAACHGLGVPPEAFGNWCYGKVLAYPAGMGGVDWHADADVNLTKLEQEVLVAWGDLDRWQPEEMRGRTVSAMVQLSDPSEYEGGELDLLDDDGQVVTMPAERGTVVVITAHRRHRVRPVSAGCRLSLVVFFGWSPRAKEAA